MFVGVMEERPTPQTSGTMAAPTFYIYDYETYGLDTQRDRIAQFAGLRTDCDLNPIAPPQVYFGKLSGDYIPSPAACMVTGLDPSSTNRRGLDEVALAACIEREFATPNTCRLGYNSIRFDDEITRNLFYRNFIDPYAAEWQHGNSRWDLLDVVRMVRALRPQGMVWPEDADGTRSNRLECLTTANNITHTAAHDALSDVEATLALARLVRDCQPRLFNYLLQHRDKHSVRQRIDLQHRQPFVHTSGMFANAYCNTSLLMPLMVHPDYGNHIICYDLRFDPTPLIELPASEVMAALFGKLSAPDSVRIAIKGIYMNKCPAIAPLSVLDDAASTRIGLDLSVAQRYRAHLLQHLQTVLQKLTVIYAPKDEPAPTDPDLAIYSGGFFSTADRARFAHMRTLAPEMLSQIDQQFDDARVPEMLFRYRARNYPQTLSADEMQLWRAHCHRILSDGSENFWQALDQLRLSHPDKLPALESLADYFRSLLRSASAAEAVGADGK